MLPFYSGRTESKDDFPSSQVKYVEPCPGLQSPEYALHQLLHLLLCVSHETLAFEIASVEAVRVSRKTQL